MNQQQIEKIEGDKIFWPIRNHWTWQVEWRTKPELIQTYDIERKKLRVDEYCLRDKIDDVLDVHNVITQWWTVYEVMWITIWWVKKEFITVWHDEKLFDGDEWKINHRISSMLMIRKYDKKKKSPTVHPYSKKVALMVYKVIKQNWILDEDAELQQLYNDNKRLKWWFTYGLTLEEKFWYDMLDSYLWLDFPYRKDILDKIKEVLTPLFKKLKESIEISTEYYLWFSSGMID